MTVYKRFLEITIDVVIGQLIGKCVDKILPIELQQIGKIRSRFPGQKTS